ncbi:P13 family porin [Treponema sp. OMZ 788]|uniref:P13 family porin n=1 Tax=Treponema sp. OMZ 788 TaxID=2563664 RepID=UPI0020A4C45D|nr:P13 family porin [Treponema sp. OMZ 788]
MKKLFMFLLTLLVGISLYSEEKIKEAKEDDENFSYYLTVDQLINKSLFKNKSLISEYSKNLSSEQILLLQEKYKKNIIRPLLLNIFIGFGSGNFACGDIVGGCVHAGIDILATSLGIAFYIHGMKIFLSPSLYHKEALASDLKKFKHCSLWWYHSRHYCYSKPCRFVFYVKLICNKLQ